MTLPRKRARPRRKTNPVRPTWEHAAAPSLVETPERHTAEYRAVAAEVQRRAGNRCEAKLPGCWGAGTDPHHIIPVSEGGPVLVPAVWMLWLCRSCHGIIHSAAGRAAAETAGHIAPRRYRAL